MTTIVASLRRVVATMMMSVARLAMTTTGVAAGSGIPKAIRRLHAATSMNGVRPVIVTMKMTTADHRRPVAGTMTMIGGRLRVTTMTEDAAGSVTLKGIRKQPVAALAVATMTTTAAPRVVAMMTMTDAPFRRAAGMMTMTVVRLRHATTTEVGVGLGIRKDTLKRPVAAAAAATMTTTAGRFRRAGAMMMTTVAHTHRVAAMMTTMGAAGTAILEAMRKPHDADGKVAAVEVW